MVVGLTLAGKIRLAYWILASAVGILVAARIRIPFRTISNPAPRTDKAVSFHAVCVVDVNADKSGIGIVVLPTVFAFTAHT